MWSGRPADRPPPQRIAGITAMLQRSLEDLLLEGLRASDVDVVRHCLRTYAAIDKTRDAEALVGQVLVKPYLEQVRAPAGQGAGGGRGLPPGTPGGQWAGSRLGRRDRSNRIQVWRVERARPQMTAPQPSVGAPGMQSAQDTLGQTGGDRGQPGPPGVGDGERSERQDPQRWPVERRGGLQSVSQVHGHSGGAGVAGLEQPEPDWPCEGAGPQQFPA